MQVVGRNCAVCGARIVTAADGHACASCSAALHTACAGGHTCATQKKPAPPPVTPSAAQRRWVKIGAPLLGVLVASAVVPPFRAWRAERRVAERAADRLGCAASEIEVAREAGQVIARGCGTSVHYLQVCGRIDRAECLEEIDTAPGP